MDEYQDFQSETKKQFLHPMFSFAFGQSEVLSNFIRSYFLGRLIGWTAMKIGDWLKSEVEYGRDLADSGWQGARSALLDKPVGEILSHSVRASWAPTVMGAGIGALCGLIAQRRKPKTSVVVAMGVVGSFVGFSAGVAWETRQLSSGIARGAMRNIGSTRDSHWLGKHPINFG
jgi:uncharacterized membrane protein YeaQ/YmgE (transglycosylase-associated protein family)